MAAPAHVALLPDRNGSTNIKRLPTVRIIVGTGARRFVRKRNLGAQMAIEEMNRDVNPPSEFTDAYAFLRPVIENELIAAEFAQAEKKAVFWKKVFQGLGYVALGATAAALLILAYQLTLGASDALTLFGAGVGCLGLISQFLFFVLGPRDRWLMQRFAAERIRCLKFQLYAALLLKPARDIVPLIEGLTERGLANIGVEIRGGIAAIERFSPADVFVDKNEPAGALDPENLQQIKESYQTLRLGVQRQHFLGRVLKLREQQNLPEALAKVGLWTASLAILFDLAWSGYRTFFNGAFGDTPKMVQFMTLAIFVLSASIYVYRHGQALEAHIARYQRFGNLLARVEAKWAEVDSAGEILELVRQTESLCLQELEAFCSTIRRTTFSL